MVIIQYVIPNYPDVAPEERVVLIPPLRLRTLPEKGAGLTVWLGMFVFFRVLDDVEFFSCPGCYSPYTSYHVSRCAGECGKTNSAVRRTVRGTAVLLYCSVSCS